MKQQQALLITTVYKTQVDFSMQVFC